MTSLDKETNTADSSFFLRRACRARKQPVHRLPRRVGIGAPPKPRRMYRRPPRNHDVCRQAYTFKPDHMPISIHVHTGPQIFKRRNWKKMPEIEYEYVYSLFHIPNCCLTYHHKAKPAWLALVLSDPKQAFLGDRKTQARAQHEARTANRNYGKLFPVQGLERGAKWLLQYKRES